MDVTLTQYRTYYKWLAYKIACAIVVVAVVPLVMMAASSRYFFVGSYKQKVLEHLTALVRTQQQKISEFVTERIDSLRLIGLTTGFQQLSDQTVMHDRFVTLQQMFGASLLGLTFRDRQGSLISGAGIHGRPGDRSWDGDLAKVLESGAYVGEVRGGTTGVNHFILAVSVEHSTEQRILALTIAADSFNELLEDPQWAKAGRPFLLDPKGEVLAPTRSGYIPVRPDCDETGKEWGLPQLDISVREAADGSALCIRADVKHSNWVLEFAANTDEAYGAFSQPRMFALSTLLLGIAGIVVVAIVISIRVSKYVARVDQEKQLINEHLVQTGKLAALGEMASGMAHEINNPVGIMVQEAQWIQALLPGGGGNLEANLDEIGASLKEIQAQGSRCRDIILKLINFTRTDEPVAESLQLNELVREIIGLCHQRAHRMKIELQLNLDPELPLVSVAPSEVQQVLINIMNNSLDAMEQHGGIIEISTSTTARYAVVDVRDTGPGIPQKNLGRIFDPFFSTKPEGKGTGLGLSICYVMMKKMKADITVTSEEGNGTTFHLFFPLEERERLAANGTPIA